MKIKLRFINRSQDANNSEVLIFQKNVVANFTETAVAWKVIKNCGKNCYHPFFYSTDLEVGIGDDFGNYSPRLKAKNGSLFVVSATSIGGRWLAYAGPGNSSKDISLRNDLQMGAINASVYAGGQMLATKTCVAPGQKAVFEFKPTIWIGAVSQVEEGQVMNSAILNSVNTELSLMGIASADIVMSGGGPGQGSMPLEFCLENVVMA